MNQVPTTNRLQRIFTTTCRSVAAILVLYSGFHVFLIFRELNRDSSSYNLKLNPLSEDSLSLVDQRPLLDGVWLFDNVDETLTTGSTDEKGIQSLIGQYQQRYREQDIMPHVDWGRFFRTIHAVEQGQVLKSGGQMVVSKAFTDPGSGNTLVVVAAEVQPGRWWYLATSPTAGKRPIFQSAGPQWMTLTSGLKCTASKFDSRGNIQLLWANTDSRQLLDRRSVLSGWERCNIEFSATFPDNTERFDYTCKLVGETVRVLGICDNDQVTDLIVVRL